MESGTYLRDGEQNAREASMEQGKWMEVRKRKRKRRRRRTVGKERVHGDCGGTSGPLFFGYRAKRNSYK
jgi:hypothetical protein